MDKQQALKELKELQDRASALEAIINAPELPTVIHGILLEPSKEKEHWYLTSAASVSKAVGAGSSEEKYGLAYVSEEAINKALKQMELHQRCRVAMAKDWCDVKVVWGADTTRKYVLRPDSSNRLIADYFYETYYPFHFLTQRAAKAFINSLTVEEQRLFIMGADA